MQSVKVINPAGLQKPSSKSPNQAALVSDIGIVKKVPGKKGNSPVADVAPGSASSKSGAGDSNTASVLLEDSFEKYYNKDLDLDED